MKCFPTSSLLLVFTIKEVIDNLPTKLIQWVSDRIKGLIRGWLLEKQRSDSDLVIDREKSKGQESRSSDVWANLLGEYPIVSVGIPFTQPLEMAWFLMVWSALEMQT